MFGLEVLLDVFNKHIDNNNIIYQILHIYSSILSLKKCVNHKDKILKCIILTITSQKNKTEDYKIIENCLYILNEYYVINDYSVLLKDCEILKELIGYLATFNQYEKVIVQDTELFNELLIPSIFSYFKKH